MKFNDVRESQPVLDSAPKFAIVEVEQTAVEGRARKASAISQHE